MENQFQAFGGYSILEHLGSDSGFPPEVTLRTKSTAGITVIGQVRHGDHKNPNEFKYDKRIEDSTWSNGNHYGEWLRFDPKPVFNRTGCVDGSNITEPEWEDRDSAFNLALERLNDKVRGDLDLGVDLVEAGQTKRMIRSLDRVTKFARISRIGHGVADLSRSLANGWLEWQYGWRPLCQDVFGALDEGLNIIEKRLRHVKARGTIPTDKTVGYGGFIDGLDNLSVTEKINGKQSCEISLWLEIPATRVDPARWSSLNPISLGWEVIPYSFVVDWFIDIGSYIRNVETALLYGTQFRTGYVSELLVHNGHARMEPSEQFTGNFPFEILNKIRDFEKKRQVVKFRRGILVSYPFPRQPHFKADLGSQRLFSAAALLRQFLKR